MKKSFEPGFIDPRELAFDIDGVFADTINTFIEIAQKEYGLSHVKREKITTFDLSKCLDLDKDLILEIICKALNDENTLRTKPFPDAAEILTEFSKKSPLIFVTARVWGESIKKWIHNQLPEVPRDRIKVYATGNPDKKLDVLRWEGIKYFVEDRLETCYLLHEAGIEPIVFDQPWNQEPHPFIRVGNWLELKKLINLNHVNPDNLSSDNLR
ncbi:MAG TPA: haloacid dehalogenase [Deltaproteobacteria bacterium]|nr:MAG: haloacid dehalogenase [Deltaproteobacteria bacterium]RLB08096.1 MAG: haloacid dehalogenase [Deltaproteobacteria bacterium]HDM78848.1 haloacid dehalogenase [Deltaproteobacteria bacterium]HEC31851.1 haloacid dehalogenase [Deltaproteobacteria bacterium]